MRVPTNWPQQLPFTDDSPVHHTHDPDGMRAALANIYSSRGLQPQDEAAMVGYLYLFIASLMKETSVQTAHGFLFQPVCAERHQVHPVQLFTRYFH